MTLSLMKIISVLGGHMIFLCPQPSLLLVLDIKLYSFGLGPERQRE